MNVLALSCSPRGEGQSKSDLMLGHLSEGMREAGAKVEGSCYLEIAKSEIRAAEGQAASPTLTIDAPFEVWMDVMAGKADGQQAFMQGNYQVSGDLSLHMRMKELFGG